MKFRYAVLILIWSMFIIVGEAMATPYQIDRVEVGLYKMFEAQISNNNSYENKFTDIELLVNYKSPSGEIIGFSGFYDGDGRGSAEGNVWKIRFMPNEVGTWTYEYRWSDGSPGGKGTFECTDTDAGKGILKAYSQNPHWFAYNGTDPVWLKSYYETGHGSIGQDFDWVVENVYDPLISNGYNHLQVNWLLSLCCFDQYYLDGPEPETLDLALYQEGDLFGTMNLDVWKRMEQHLGYLNDKDVGVHMFLGVDGSQNEGPDWNKLAQDEKRAFVKYMVARLAPFANLAGWNFVWEVPGDREDHELGFIRLVKEYDVFDHLRTYEDEFPRENFYHLPEYTFAAIENHQIASPDKKQERHLWKDAWTHHMACLLGYAGKPVFMSEGNALWRRFWHERVGATQDDLRRSAWACATAGASFTWNGHEKEYELYAGGPSGLPFNHENPFTDSEKFISILTQVMEEEVEFYKMKPHDELLAEHQSLKVYALAEPGQQYLVFAPDGEPFSLKLGEGNYQKVIWINTLDGKQIINSPLEGIKEDSLQKFKAPNREDDWVLIIRK